MKKSILAFALGVLALSSGISLAQQPPGAALKCCTCVNGLAVVPPPIDLSTGLVPWTVNPGGPTAFIIATPNVSWVNLPPAKWVQSVNSTSPASAGPGPFHYSTTFTVPKCDIPFSALSLNGTYAADNGATITLAPGTSTCSGALANPFCFKAPGMPLSFPVSTTPGVQTLKADVTNQPSTVSGLLVKATITPRCPVCPVVFNLPMQGGNENTACPVLGQGFTRAQAASAPAASYLHIMLASLDLQCASKGPGFKMQQVKFLTCCADVRGAGFGPNATATLTCGP
jgi:hypothetical protein